MQQERWDSMTMASARVVVTGIGIVSPLGLTREASWLAATAGVSGAAAITRFNAPGYKTTFAAEVRDFDPSDTIGKKDVRRMDRFTQFAIVAAGEALIHARLDISPENSARVGVLIGTAMGGIETVDLGAQLLFERGPDRLSPFFLPMMLPNMASGMVAIATGARGPNFAPTSACASSAHAIGEAAAMIRRGVADVMIAGGAEAPICRLGVAGFSAMGALSTRNDAPGAASRPFDAERDGFVLGEGAAVLVLERADVADARGAMPLAVVAGYAATDDAHHMVQPSVGGEGAARAMTAALEGAGMEPADIDYLNAHGTSTQLNEKMETLSIKRAFGAAASSLAISSTKSMTGHLLGAAGGLEAAFCVLALRDQVLPPTINQSVPDPDCDLDYVPNRARPAAVRHTLSTSLGFGGHNTALILSAWRP